MAALHQKLVVSRGSGGTWSAYIFIREALCQAQVDERNEGFFIPGLSYLFGRKRNQNGALLVCYLKCAGNGISLVFRVGIGEQEPGALCLLYSDPEGMVLANPSIGQFAVLQ